MVDKLSQDPKIIQEFIIEGAGCASCVGKIETAIAKVADVDFVAMNFVDRSVLVKGNAKGDLIVKAVEDAGYHAKVSNAQTAQASQAEKEQAEALYYKKLMKHCYLALALGVPLMFYGLFIGEMTVTSGTEQIAWLLVGLLTLAVMLTSGRHFYLGAYRSFKNHNANMDTLIALGTGTAWLYSMVVVLAPDILPLMARHVYFEASMMIIGLINLGLALELKARGKTSEAVKRLIGLQAKSASVIRDNQEVKISLEEVRLGDKVKIRPGEKIPVDGIILEGHSSLDEAMLTGEPMPVAKGPDDEVAAGTINTKGSFIFKATRIGKDTALAQIIQMVKQAQNAKPAIGRLADTISAYFVPSVMILAVITGLIWLNFGPDPVVAFAIASASTLLIIACPCALGLATPMSVMVGVGKAAEAGVLIRNGEALQTASDLSVMVLDKTGTITQGKPSVTDIECFGGFTQTEILKFAASLELNSEHPLGMAIVNSAQEKSISLASVESFNAISGKGITGYVEQHSLALGNQGFMLEQGVDIRSQQDLAKAYASSAKTPLYFAIDGKLEAMIAISDPIKSDSISAIEALQGQGLRVIMLTGDNTHTAAAVAKHVGIEEYFADVLPADKADIIKKLQAQGETVAMVGDGINDAPSLALANVGFAIGTGTDVAIESADITLMRGALTSVVDAIEISKATLKNIKQNLFGAFIYNLIGIPLAAGVLYPFFGILLSPVIAGAAMALSSVTVVTNANRLRLLNSSIKKPLKTSQETLQRGEIA